MSSYQVDYHQYLDNGPAMPELDFNDSNTFTPVSQWVFDRFVAAGFDVVLATLHGSYLYGLAHEDSDTDLFVVVADDMPNYNCVVDGQDVQVLNLKTWVEVLHRGSHQSVEACVSPYKVCSDKWRAFVNAQRPSRYKFAAKCSSAAESFFSREGDVKSHRHARRLLSLSVSYMYDGSFPVASASEYC